MTPADRITGSWMASPAARAVMTALEAARPASARYVGGCVRNTLRGAPVEDIDIATQLAPPQVMAALESAGIRAIPTGIEHGTVTAVHDGSPVEITTLRRDVETDGRRAVVAFTEDWAEDAARRDFRLNAIYAGADGRLFEIIPGSIGDALSGRVIFIGEAGQRLAEDYLRILRFYRFNAWYGAGIDPAGQAACAAHRQGLKGIAAERIWKEMKRTLAAPDPAPALTAMEEAGVLGLLLPGAVAGLLPAVIACEQAAGLGADPMRRLMALIPRRLSEAARAANALRMSNDEAARLSAWAKPGLGHVLGLDEAGLRAALYRHGPEAVADRAVVEAASGGSGAQHVLALAGRWVRPDFPLGGEDALAAGLEGAEIGARLRALEEDWIASDFSLGRDVLLARLGA